MPDFKMIAFTNAVEGRDAEFNRWYDDVHLGEVMAIPGFSGARRFRIHPTGEEPPRHAYVAIYDMNTDDPGAVLAALVESVEGGRLDMSDALADDAEMMLVEQISEKKAP